jgi:formylglycine-generating enzyme required for sulfatase activity
MPAVWAQTIAPALRGGSWINNHQNARLSARNEDHPNNQWNNNGFRVAASHNFVRPASSTD